MAIHPVYGFGSTAYGPGGGVAFGSGDQQPDEQPGGGGGLPGDNYGQFGMCQNCCQPAELGVCSPRTYNGGEYSLDGIRYSWAGGGSSNQGGLSCSITISGPTSWTILASVEFPITDFVVHSIPGFGGSTIDTVSWLIDPQEFGQLTPVLTQIIGGTEQQFDDTFGLTPQQFLNALSLLPNPNTSDVAESTTVLDVPPVLSAYPSNLTYNTFMHRVQNLGYTSYYARLRNRFKSPHPTYLICTIQDPAPFPGVYYLPQANYSFSFSCPGMTYVNHVLDPTTTQLVGVFASSNFQASAEVPVSQRAYYWRQIIPFQANPLPPAAFQATYLGRSGALESETDVTVTYDLTTGICSKIRATCTFNHISESLQSNGSVNQHGSLTLETPPDFSELVPTTDTELGQLGGNTYKLLNDANWWRQHAASITHFVSSSSVGMRATTAVFT